MAKADSAKNVAGQLSAIWNELKTIRTALTTKANKAPTVTTGALGSYLGIAVSYRKIDGFVQVRLQGTSTAVIANGSVYATLPAGCRPVGSSFIMSLTTGNANGESDIDIGIDGRMIARHAQVPSGSAVWGSALFLAA